MVLQVVNGIQVSEANIAYDVLKEVGPAGEFITHQHTFDNFKRMSSPKLMNRMTREGWEAAGSPDMVEKAYEKSLEILKNQKAAPRSEDVIKQLDSIYAEFEAANEERKAKK